MKNKAPKKATAKTRMTMLRLPDADYRLLKALAVELDMSMRQAVSYAVKKIAKRHEVSV